MVNSSETKSTERETDLMKRVKLWQQVVQEERKSGNVNTLGQELNDDSMCSRDEIHGPRNGWFSRDLKSTSPVFLDVVGASTDAAKEKIEEVDRKIEKSFKELVKLLPAAAVAAGFAAAAKIAWDTYRNPMER